MIIDIICDSFTESNYSKIDRDTWEYLIKEAEFWAEDNPDKNFLRAVRRVYECVRQDVVNLREFKDSIMDYMESAGYGGSMAYNHFKNLSLRKIGEIIGDNVKTVKR